MCCFGYDLVAYYHLVASVMKLAISVIESAFRLHSDSAILSAVSVMIFVNFGSTNNLFPFFSKILIEFFVFTAPLLSKYGSTCEATTQEKTFTPSHRALRALRTE